MLTGKELGKAISTAIDLKLASGAVKTKAEIARHFGIRPPSIYDWIRKGSISKDKLPELFRYFADVVGPEHWGLESRDSWLSLNTTTLEPDDTVTATASAGGGEVDVVLRQLTPTRAKIFARLLEMSGGDDEELAKLVDKLMLINRVSIELEGRKK